MFCRMYAQFFTLTYIQLTDIDITQLVQLTATVSDLSNGMRLSIQKYPHSKLYSKNTGEQNINIQLGVLQYRLFLVYALPETIAFS